MELPKNRGDICTGHRSNDKERFPKLGVPSIWHEHLDVRSVASDFRPWKVLFYVHPTFCSASLWISSAALAIISILLIFPYGFSVHLWMRVNGWIKSGTCGLMYLWLSYTLSIKCTIECRSKPENTIAKPFLHSITQAGRKKREYWDPNWAEMSKLALICMPQKGDFLGRIINPFSRPEHVATGCFFRFACECPLTTFWEFAWKEH